MSISGRRLGNQAEDAPSPPAASHRRSIARSPLRMRWLTNLAVGISLAVVIATIESLFSLERTVPLSALREANDWLTTLSRDHPMLAGFGVVHAFAGEEGAREAEPPSDKRLPPAQHHGHRWTRSPTLQGRECSRHERTLGVTVPARRAAHCRAVPVHPSARRISAPILPKSSHRKASPRQ